MAPFIREVVFSPMFVFGTIVEVQMTVVVWAYFWVLYSIPLVYVSVFAQYHTVFVTIVLLYKLKSDIMILPALLFLLRMSF
jgi:hypothetical protein